MPLVHGSHGFGMLRAQHLHRVRRFGSALRLLQPPRACAPRHRACARRRRRHCAAGARGRPGAARPARPLDQLSRQCPRLCRKSARIFHQPLERLQGQAHIQIARFRTTRPTGAPGATATGHACPARATHWQTHRLLLAHHPRATSCYDAPGSRPERSSSREPEKAPDLRHMWQQNFLCRGPVLLEQAGAVRWASVLPRASAGRAPLASYAGQTMVPSNASGSMRTTAFRASRRAVSVLCSLR